MEQVQVSGEGAIVPTTKVVVTYESVPIDISGRSHEKYAEACAIVRKHKRGSISLVQRHLRIGYNTAAMLLEAMVGDVLAKMPPTTELLPTPGAQP